MNLRKLAKGQPCRVRIPGICNRDDTTTVLAHLKGWGWCGSIKPPDICAVHACVECHNEIDRRTSRLTSAEVDVYVHRALCEQLCWYVDEGILQW